MTRALVVAKAPVPGTVKTRLGADVGMQVAAEVAAAALIDTLQACREAFGPDRCLLALAGDLDEAERRHELHEALDGWTVFPQRGTGLAERLAGAHADAGPDGPLLQVGMDTPQLGVPHLHDAAAALAEADAVLGPAHDGGWWLLGLHARDAGAELREVAMSAPTTYDDTRRALEDAGLSVRTTAVLRDVDTVHDADLVAAEAAHTEFARAWSGVRR